MNRGSGYSRSHKSEHYTSGMVRRMGGAEGDTHHWHVYLFKAMGIAALPPFYACYLFVTVAAEASAPRTMNATIAVSTSPFSNNLIVMGITRIKSRSANAMADMVFMA